MNRWPRPHVLGSKREYYKQSTTIADRRPPSLFVNCEDFCAMRLNMFLHRRVELGDQIQPRAVTEAQSCSLTNLIANLRPTGSQSLSGIYYYTPITKPRASGTPVVLVAFRDKSNISGNYTAGPNNMQRLQQNSLVPTPTKGYPRSAALQITYST